MKLILYRIFFCVCTGVGHFWTNLTNSSKHNRSSTTFLKWSLALGLYIFASALSKVCFNLLFTQRYRIFFPGKSLPPLTHSFWEIFVLFFFPFQEKKKKHLVFFFFPEKVCKPLTQLWDGQPPKKGQNRLKIALFVDFQIFSLFFFFLPKWATFLFFFFSQKKFARHSLTRFQEAEKKNSAGKKKHNFHSLTRKTPKKCKN